MIALVDCNNFYASCERLFQPHLLGRPVVILSNNDGCVIARSEEAKEIGIKMGAPAFLIEDMLVKHNVAIFSSNYTLYGSMSNRVMKVLQEHCPTVEIYSIDEAFLYLSDLPRIDLKKYCVNLLSAVGAVGIPVTVGVAPSKTLAKMANRYAKKTKLENSIFVLDSDKTTEVLRYTEVEDIWGVGPQYAKLLRRHGFKTAADVCSAPGDWMRKNMTVVGLRLWNELRGNPCIEMEAEIPDKQNICVARSFGRLLSEKEDVREALANYTSIAARKLRKQGSCCSVVNVFIQTNNFRSQDPQYFRSINVQLQVATASTPELLHYAGIGLDQIWQEGFNFKKVGVMLLELKPASQLQSALFDQRDRPRDERLMKAVDTINQLAGGRELVKFATQGFGRKWKLRQERLSPCYTTRLDQILAIKI